MSFAPSRPSASRPIPSRRGTPALIAIAVSLSLGACASGGSNPLLSDAGPSLRSADAAGPQSELQKATVYWGKQAAANPGDPRAAVNYARNLKASGAKRDAMLVLQQAHSANPNDRELNSEYGRLALEHDQITLAEKLLEQADDPEQPDWRVVSARGTVLAKQGRYIDAIALYERARLIAPDQPSILNNMAMAQAMAGQSNKAEGLLREAAARPDADRRIKQNLALVLGLNGKHEEAKSAGAGALPPDASAHNAALVKNLVNTDQPATPVAAVTPAASVTPVRAARGPTSAAIATASVPVKAKSKGRGQPAEAALDASELVRRLADGDTTRAP